MRYRALGLLLAIFVIASSRLEAQRPLIGFGIGGGVILGTTRVDLRGHPGGEEDSAVIGGIDLDHTGIFDAHLEVYPIPHIAIRGHGMWGRGDLRLNLDDTDLGSERDMSRVDLTGLDLGISIWPWTPSSAGFTPFATFGVGRVTYDFGSSSRLGDIETRGKRRERAVLFGLGADMNIWRSVTLRIEAVNHRIDSPLDPGEGLGRPSHGNRHVSNVRLSADLHIYLPFTNNSGGHD